MAHRDTCRAQNPRFRLVSEETDYETGRVRMIRGQPTLVVSTHMRGENISLPIKHCPECGGKLTGR